MMNAGLDGSVDRSPPLSTMSKKGGEWDSDEMMSKEDKGKVYANNQPKIMLEVLTARSTLLILLITYTVAIIGFSIDFTFIRDGFDDNEIMLPTTNCAFGDGRVPTTLVDAKSPIGCYNGSNWYGFVNDVKNVINIELETVMLNASYYPAVSANNIDFDVELWACYLSVGCGQRFAADSDTSYDKYHRVVTLVNRQINSEEMVTEGLATGIYMGTLIPFTFQNQESIPTRGIIKSYYAEVRYRTSDLNPFIPTNAQQAQYIQYMFDAVNRPNYNSIVVLILVMMIITGLALLSYLYIMHFHNKGRKWLPEQCWLVLYLIFVILFQNPIYVTLYFSEEQRSVDTVYASYVFDAVGQVGLLVVWLMFSGAVRRRSQPEVVFYVPKLIFGGIIFTTYLVILTFQFPNLSPDGSDRSPVESVQNWSTEDKEGFVAFSLCYVALLFVWSVLWFMSISWSGKILGQLPYMSTRYLQLSYRFFSMQATLVTLFYVLQYATVVYKISVTSRSEKFASITTLAEDTNTVFRQQTQLFGKNLFLTVYALALTFVCLPHDFLSDNEYISNLQVSYVISEDERDPLIKLRKHAMHKRNRMQQSFLKNFVPYKLNVFCANLALALCNLSFEAYYDPPGMDTQSGFGHDPTSLKELDVEKYDFTIVKTFYDPKHDTFCCICRHVSEPKIVVMFRGTSSRTHWNHNLNYRKMPLDLVNNQPSPEVHSGLEVPTLPKDPFLYRQLNKAMRALNIFAHDDDSDDDSDCEVRMLHATTSTASLPIQV